MQIELEIRINYRGVAMISQGKQYLSLFPPDVESKENSLSKTVEHNFSSLHCLLPLLSRKMPLEEILQSSLQHEGAVYVIFRIFSLAIHFVKAKAGKHQHQNMLGQSY